VIEVSRYLLAVIVAQTHLWPIGQEWMGQVSVFAFYTLSGYLITRVLNVRYGFDWRGTARFVANRVLRLWPAYLIMLALTLLMLRWLPLSDFFPLIRNPTSAVDVATNLLVVGQVTFDFRQWLPMAKPLVTSWSLSIEICSYLLLALYFGRSPVRLGLLAALGLLGMTASTAWCAASSDLSVYGPYCFQQRYGVVQAGFFPFACGGLYHFYEKPIAVWVKKRWWLATACLGVAMATMCLGYSLSATIGPFLGIPLAWQLLTAAIDHRPSRLQDFFGRASYHVFIAHMPIAATLATGMHVPIDSLAIYSATLAIAFALSSVLVPLEWRINKLRRQIAR
jgi:peptidoglycan/LPS O-acetylase OafA/YrhL